MSPVQKIKATNNIYTALLGLAAIALIGAAAYVIFRSISDYGTVMILS